MDNIVYRDYYKIPTASGNFYLYREYLNRGWDNINGSINHEYNDFIEFFTGIVATPHSNLLNVNNQKEKIIYSTIKDELINLDKDKLEEELSYNNYIDYNYITFHSSFKSNKYSFANKPNYNNKLPYYDTRFIIGLAPCFSPERDKFVSPHYDYYKLSSVEFANEIKGLIDKYESKEKVAEIMLERMINQSLVCQKRNNFITNQEHNIQEETNQAEEYIKKLIY